MHLEKLQTLEEFKLLRKIPEEDPVQAGLAGAGGSQADGTLSLSADLCQEARWVSQDKCHPDSCCRWVPWAQMCRQLFLPQSQTLAEGPSMTPETAWTSRL